MPSIEEITNEIARKTMILFFLIDTSGSMQGDKIGQVNAGMEDTILDIKDMVNPDAKVKVAVLEFSAGARWQTPEPIEIENFTWSNLEADGLTDLGEACRKLDEKLSRKAFMRDGTGNYAPAIILISDGNPTDDYEKSLEQLKKNNWFKSSLKVALAVGSDVKHENLEMFTGNSETVIPIHNKAMLRKMIRFVSVRASQIASRSSAVTEENINPEISSKQQDFIEALKDISIDTDINEEEVEW